MNNDVSPRVLAEVKRLLRVPAVKTPFGEMLKLAGLIPLDCDCVMVLVNFGGGLTAGLSPVGFLRLPHQVYVEDLARMIERHERQQDMPYGSSSRILEIVICPVRTDDYVIAWRVEN